MSNEAASTDLRLTVEVDRGAGVVQRVSVHVEGQGDLALQTATRIAEIYERAAAELLRSPAGAATSVRSSSAPEPAGAATSVRPSSAPEPMAAQPAEASGDTVAAPPEHPAPVNVSIVERQPAQSDALEASPARPTPWFRRHRVRISGGVGIVMFLLAVGVPLLVPVEMRREILPMPIAFGLVGALSLFSALLPEPDGKPRAAAPAAPVAEVVRSAAATTPRAGRRAAAPVSAGRRLVGAGFGALFALGGLIAPFALAGANPDDRFLMMIGFAPIAAIGAFLMWVFLKQAPALQGEGAAVHRARSTASPSRDTNMTSARSTPGSARDEKMTSARSMPGSAKDEKMTSALMALAVMLVVIVLLVAAATVLQMAG